MIFVFHFFFSFQKLKGIQWQHLKFADECHFVSRDLYHHKVLGPKGDKMFLIETNELGLSFTLTLLLDLSNPSNPFFIELRKESNTEWDFLLFLVQAVEAGRLQRDDILAIDNASIHFGNNTWELSTQLLDSRGATFAFLPTYSPELNPAELVFAFVKHYIRKHRHPRDHLVTLLLEALAHLPYEMLLSFYNRCINQTSPLRTE